MPGYTLGAVLGLPRLPEPRCSLEIWLYTTAKSFPYAAFVASWVYGILGQFASFIFTGMKLITHQTLEKLTGVGALLGTWPRDEEWIVVMHKADFATATGVLCDCGFVEKRLPVSGSNRRR